MISLLFLLDLFDTLFETEASPQLDCSIPIKRKLFVDAQESLKSNGKKTNVLFCLEWIKSSELMSLSNTDAT